MQVTRRPGDTGTGGARMIRLPSLLALIFCTATNASPTFYPESVRPIKLRRSQAHHVLSDHSRFAILAPELDWQQRIQRDASTPLQQLDDGNSPPDGRYVFPNVADSVHVYIMDSGIRASHSEFRTVTSTGQNTTETRVQKVFASQSSGSQPGRVLRATDSRSAECAEHGTHVASLVGGLKFGVAKGVHLKSLEVLGCDGSTDASKLITAMEWLGENVEHPALVVMAIGEVGRIPTLDRAIEQ